MQVNVLHLCIAIKEEASAQCRVSFICICVQECVAKSAYKYMLR